MSMRFMIPAVVIAAVLGTVGYLAAPQTTGMSAIADNSVSSSSASDKDRNASLETQLNNTAPAAGTDEKVVVAKLFGEEVITKADVTQLYDAIKQRAGDQAPPLDDIFWMLTDQIIASRLVIHQAMSENLHLSPEVLEALKMAREQIVQEAYIRNVFETISDEDLEARYEVFKKNFKGQEEAHARHILVKSEDAANQVIQKLRDGASFNDLAKEFSEDPGSKDNGGDLGFFSPGAMVPEFDKAVFSMKAGELSSAPVHTQFGWHVIKVDERRPMPVPEFEEVKSQLEMEAQQELLQNKIDELRKSAEIEFSADPELPAKPADASSGTTAAPAGK